MRHRSVVFGTSRTGRRGLGVVAIVALALLGCTDGRDSSPPGDADRTNSSVERFLMDTLPPGAGGTLAPARDGELVHCDGFGMADRDAQVAAGCDTVYDLQSMTKQFTAAAILKLEMMGKLRVTDPIGDYIGPVPYDKTRITVHHLLTHTAGLVGVLGGDYERLSRGEMLAGAFGSELRSPPGVDYHYSNVGYSVLAAIVEEASGMGYEQFLARHLFAPAGMTETGYVLPEWDHDEVAVEYDERGASHGRPFEHPWADDGPYWNLRGNGGLLSTARDMYRWHRALEGDEALDRHAKAQLFTPYVLEQEDGDTSYGYGWVVEQTDDGKVVWHDGGNAWSFGVFTRFLDEDVMVFWITNRHRDTRAGWNLSRLAQTVTAGVADRVRDGG